MSRVAFVPRCNQAFLPRLFLRYRLDDCLLGLSRLPRGLNLPLHALMIVHVGHEGGTYTSEEHKRGEGQNNSKNGLTNVAHKSDDFSE